MPTPRRMLSGIASALFMARRIQAGLAANINPSSTNRIPTPMRKSTNAMDLIGSKPPAGCYFFAFRKRAKRGSLRPGLVGVTASARPATQARRRLSARPAGQGGGGPVGGGGGAAAAGAPGWRSAVAAGGAAAGGLPEELLKNLKKSESGRNRKRVSLLFRPFS